MQHTDTLHTCDVCGMGMHGYFPVSLHNINMKVCNTCHTKLIAMRDSVPKIMYRFRVSIFVESHNQAEANKTVADKLSRSGLKYEYALSEITEVTDASARGGDTEPSPRSEEAGSSVHSGESRFSTRIENSAPEHLTTGGQR